MQETLRLIKELQGAKGSKAKTAILQENRDNETFKRVLYYACHPRLTYKVSEATLMQEPKYTYDTTYASFFDVCDVLSQRKAVDDVLLRSVLDFLYHQPEEERDVYRKILAKTLRLGVTAKSINKAIPGLIPEWEVQQAYPIDTYPLKDGVWFSVSQKLNGVRATFYRGNMIGRSGAIIEGLDHIVDELSPYSNLVFDGELTLRDKGDLSDNEAFRTATGIINSDEEDKTRVCFTVFDMLPVDEFNQGRSTLGYRARRVAHDELMERFKDNEHVHVLQALYHGTDQARIHRLLDQMVAEDKEGLMVNLDVPYQCKRHNGILKVKRFYTMDLPIIRIEEGSGKYAGTTGAIIVDYKGNEVGVGTGLTDEQRRFFWEFKDTYIGVLAEVKYKEISCDKKTGAESLHFPVFVALRTDKNEVSYG